MTITLSESQERDIDKIVDLVFEGSGRVATAQRRSAAWGRHLRATVEEVQGSLLKWVRSYNGHGAPWGNDVNCGGLGDVFKVTTYHLKAISKHNPDPDKITEMGREAVTTGMRGCVEHYEYAFCLAQVMMGKAREGTPIPSLRWMVEAGTVLTELAQEDPQMGLIGPGIEAHHQAWRYGEARQPVLVTLREMVELAGLET